MVYQLERSYFAIVKVAEHNSHDNRALYFDFLNARVRADRLRRALAARPLRSVVRAAAATQDLFHPSYDERRPVELLDRERARTGGRSRSIAQQGIDRSRYIMPKSESWAPALRSSSYLCLAVWLTDWHARRPTDRLSWLIYDSSHWQSRLGGPSGDP